MTHELNRVAISNLIDIKVGIKEISDGGTPIQEMVFSVTPDGSIRIKASQEGRPAFHPLDLKIDENSFEEFFHALADFRTHFHAIAALNEEGQAND